MLTTEDFTHFPLQTWEKVKSKVKKAVVFMDDRCAEALHWCGGAAAFLEAGAINIKQFSSFEACSVNEPKAVFVVSTLLKGRSVDIIRDIISVSHFQYCVVFTSVPHSVHLLANKITAELDGNPVFEQFEEKLCEWMGNMNYTAEVMYAPVLFAPISQQLIITPTLSHLFPLLSPDLVTINAKRPEKKKFVSLNDVDMCSLPLGLQILVKSLVAALNLMFEATGTREECFAVGPMSRIITGELTSHTQSKNRRKTAPNKASIIFVDRTMDLTGAVGHHGDNLVEKILTVLKLLPGHATDVQVDMLELTNLQQTAHSQNILAPGCLAQTQSSTARSLWEAMLTCKHKEAVMEVRRHLVEAASKEKLPVKMSMARVTPEQLCSYVKLFQTNWEALESHCGVLQLGLATAQTLRHPSLAQWDTCLAFERLLLQTLGDSDFPAVLRQLLPLMKSQDSTSSNSRFREDKYGPDELILLLIYLYSLADEAQHTNRDADEEELEKLERELIGVLTLVIMQETELSPLLQKLTGCSNAEELTTEKAHSAVEEMFGTLRVLSHTRDHLKQLRSIYTASDGVHQDQTRYTRRLQKLKAHYDRCEARYNKACIKQANKEKERTSFLHHMGLMQSQQSSSESDDTIILGPTPAAVIQDMSVPELTRTDRVILHKQMLGYTEEDPSSSKISEEEYAPESVESESDSLKDSDSSVDVKQLKRRKKSAQKKRKKRAQRTTSASSLEVQPLKRRHVTTSSSLAAKDPGESSSADVKDSGESSSADVNDSGESSSADVKDSGESSSADVNDSGESSSADVNGPGESSLANVNDPGESSLANVNDPGESSLANVNDSGESSSADVNDPGESSLADVNDPGESSSADVTVMTLKKKEDGSRVYNKMYSCVFCSKPYNKMARHLEDKHSDKPEVAKALKCPKGSKERRLQLLLLRNKGNRAHNNKVIKEGKGMVIPCQQSVKSAKAGDYLHCLNCEGYYKRKSLWKHMQRSCLNQKFKGLKPGTSQILALCKYEEPVPDSVKAQFWKLVLNMHHDDVTKVVRSEKSILKLGEHLFNKHGQDVTKHEYIRQKMRETARVVLQGCKDGKLEMLSDFFVPANFPHVIDAIKKVAGLDERTNIFQTPSLAVKLGYNLKQVANILECEAMISGDENTIQNVRTFRQMFETRWSKYVSSHALRPLNNAKWNVPQLIPFAEDVKTMHQYLHTKRMECQRNLKEEAVKKNWVELAKITLCEVIIFNRRREGEVSKMSLNAFTLRDTSVTHPDVELALSELEKKLCKHFQRIEIRGKCGRKVPVLLTPDMVSSMELLVQNRHNCDVLDENPYMFGRPQTLDHFKGSDIIREMAQSCGAKHPEAMSSTKLRKHMAIMSKVLNLKDNEMDDLADFLGHDIRVHRQYYRLPEGTFQLAKISKVLLALEKGQLSTFKGRNLDEISVDPEEKISVDSGSDTEEEVDSTERDSETSSSRSPGQSGVTMRYTTEVGQNKGLPSAKGPPQKKRLKWSQEEIQVVEKTFMDFIDSGKVPGKAQCLECIEASPVALKDRTWKGVKFYVKNRIKTRYIKKKATYCPLLRQILQEVFHPDRPECPDIEHMSGGLTDLLKTGFSMFMKVSRPHPSDNPLVFLFLVGGVTPSEIRLIKETVTTHKPGTQVLVLSTRLLRPTDIPELLFTTQRLVPDVGF